jgi:hypothetical protein
MDAPIAIHYNSNGTEEVIRDREAALTAGCVRGY